MLKLKIPSRKIGPLVFVLIFAIIGTYLLVSSHAATPYASINADKGSLNSPACNVTDSNASDDTAVEFGGVCSSGGNAPVNSVAPYFAASTGGASCTAGCAIAGQTIAATTGTWTCSGGCGTLSYAYQWQDCTTTAGRPPTTAACTNATGSGAKTGTYTVATGDVGHSLTVLVTASENGTAGTQTSVSGTSCNRASLPTPGTGSSSSGTSGAATPNAPAGCSPITAVVGSTQAAEKFCTNAPVSCGYPDPLSPGMVGPTGSLTTVSTNCGCLPSGASASGNAVNITGNNVTVQNINAPGGFTITGTNDSIVNSQLGGYNAYSKAATFTHDFFTNGTIDGNINTNGETGSIFDSDWFNQGCEDILITGGTVKNTYLTDNKFYSGCHYETTYTSAPGSGAVPTVFDHDVGMCNFPDNWCMFWDDHAFGSGTYNVTISNSLIANDGFYVGGGDTINGGGGDVVSNNRVSQAYQSGGGSDGGWGLGKNSNCSGVNFSNNLFDDTLATMSCN